MARDLTHLDDWTADELEAEVRRHNHLYWIANQPEISDYDYDRLVECLKRLRPDSPVLYAVGAAGAEGFVENEEAGTKVVHEAAMLSLDKCYTLEDLHSWFDKFEGAATGSPKIDGVACSLRYDGTGALSLSSTRGDGIRGELITENVKRVHDIPLNLDIAGPIEVRGEIYMPLSVFRSFSDNFANPRNLAAGGLKLKEPEKTRFYDLHFFAYELLGTDASTEWEKVEKLEQMGFTPVPTRLLGRDELESFYLDVVAGRETDDYETDGVVYKTNVIAEHERLGFTAHHPRWAIAYKFQGESGVSHLRAVLWDVSRTGSINPVAIVDPVVLSGASVTRASLHNLGMVEKLGLTLNAKVELTRRGGVIPNLERVVEEGDAEIYIPDTCPGCGSPVRRDGDFLYCPNPQGCVRQQMRTVRHFVDVIECMGFGEKLLVKLFEEGLVKEPPDLYELTAEQLLQLERMGKKLATKLVAEVDAHREIPLATFLASLGIRDLGRQVSQILAEFGSLAAVLEKTEAELATIHGIGEVIARHVVAGLVERRPTIDRLLEHVTLTTPAPAAKVELAEGEGSPFTGKSVLFTGTLEKMKRKEAQASVVAVGGSAPGSITKDLDYLVIGDADYEKFQTGWQTGKLKKAVAFNAKGANIQIVGESRFLELLGDQ